MAEVEQPESPPRPFPARSPEFPRDQFHADRFSPMYNGASTMHNGTTSTNADDPKSCFIASTTFSFFVAITMAFGLYSPENLRLGPNASILIQPNTLFVESIEVVEVGAAKSSMLFGFYEAPALDVMVTWQETHKISLPSNTHKEWVHYLNEGSQINVSYSVSSWGFSSIGLIIAKGNAELAEWLKDPSYPDTTFSWNIIHVIVAGNGSIQKDILKSSAYYTGVGNLNPEIFMVDLNMSIKASMYDTTKPYYKCRPAEGRCTFPLSFMGANAAVLTSPGRVPGMVNGNCYVKISYGPRWIAYVVVAGGLILLMLLFNYFTNHLRRTEQDMPSDPPGGIGSERNPLLLRKDDDTSASEDGDHEDDAQAGVEANPVKGDEDRGHTCAICFEAPKDCFFIPCGHCVACFGCANRIVETSATCPICRRKTKKAKKIYTV
ncbi:E3 ubiquitin-protein ligase APD2 isoform X2 [Salvia hispanica]|uniref:E3 ubiquitin-protein ligase APD2 isoform X2 n=1 Tax=Salvia hispanica TaxID=49212 RepID=UPI0020096961|nr:E3 ubiquitin-protein ligase APD2 isoform X2 [Salvia hispanica]